MPVYRWSSSLLRLAAAAVLASVVVFPSQAQIALGTCSPGAWGYYVALPCYAFPYAIAYPVHTYSGRWLIAGGLRGAAGRLHLH
jgi:hypothetical protein